MFTRREFLHTTLIAVALPAAAASCPAIGRNSRARLIAVGGCPEGDAFCAADRHAVMRLGADVGEILQLLLRDAGELEVTAYFGLTRDSDYVVVRHALLERGLREIYLGDHVDSPVGWRHELRGGAQTLDRFAPAFAPEVTTWAKNLAGCCGSVADVNEMTTRRVLATAAYARPPGAAMQLKSWAFHA